MPWQSGKQRRYMYANHSEIAKRWDREYGPEPDPKKRPRRKKKDRTWQR